MGKSPAFQLYASDFDMDTASWDNDEVGIYFRLLMYQWVNGYVPSDIDRLAKIARISPKKFQKRWQIVSEKFCNNGDNALINKRMEKTRQEQYNYKKLQSDSGKRGVEIKRKKGIYPFKQPLKQPLKQPSKPKPSSSSSSSPSIKKEKKIYKRKMPDDFILTEKLKNYGLGKGILKNEISNLFESFKESHKSKGSLMLNWDSAWHTWVLNEIKWHPGKYMEDSNDKYASIRKTV